MASVTLNFDAGHIDDPLEPDIDDLGRINVVIAARRNGGQITDPDTTGPLGTTAIGVYRSQVDINPDADTALPQHAHYHLVLGTDPDPRYPTVSVDLDANPSLAATVSAIDVGDLVSLTGLPQDLGQPTGDTLVLGYTETIGSHRRVIAFNTRQGGILTHVGFLDGDAAACLQTAGAQLNTAITAEQVSLPVMTTSGPLFTTSPPAGAQIIVADREIMTVTAVASAAFDTFSHNETNTWGNAESGQPWTNSGAAAADYDISGGKGLHTQTGTGTLMNSSVDTNSVDGEGLLSSSCPVAPTGAAIEIWMALRFTDTSNYYAVIVGFQTAGTFTLQLAKRVAGSLTLIGSSINLGTYTPGNLIRIRFQVIGSQLRVRGWDFTAGVPEPLNWQSEAVDTSLTTGTQAGCLSRRVTGNTNGTQTISFDNFEIVNPQTVTVTRDPNQRRVHASAAWVKVYRALRLTL